MVTSICVSRCTWTTSRPAVIPSTTRRSKVPARQEGVGQEGVGPAAWVLRNLWMCLIMSIRFGWRRSPGTATNPIHPLQFRRRIASTLYNTCHISMVHVYWRQTKPTTSTSRSHYIHWSFASAGVETAPSPSRATAHRHPATKARRTVEQTPPSATTLASFHHHVIGCGNAAGEATTTYIPGGRHHARAPEVPLDLWAPLG